MLTRSTEYALRALVYIQLQNWKKLRPGVKEITREIVAPEAFVAKILQTLTRHRLVDSRKGRGGGFFFNEGQKDLTLYDVIIVMEGESCFTRCGFGFNLCSDKNPCPLHDRYIKVRDEFLNIAKTETIQSVSRKIEEGKAYLTQKLNNNP